MSDLVPFVREIFAEDEKLVSCILHGILQAQSPRLSDISHAMEGASPSANYKALNRFPSINSGHRSGHRLDEVDPWMPLIRLFDENAPFGDVTEIERRQAKKTSYVGTLKTARPSASGC